MTYGLEITMEQARNRPQSWRWSPHGDFCGDTLADALADAAPGTVLRAWQPMDLPAVEACALDIEEAITEWGCDDTVWWALATFYGGEPDGNQLLDSPTWRAGLRALLAAELAKIAPRAYEEAGEWVRVPQEDAP